MDLKFDRYKTEHQCFENFDSEIIFDMGLNDPLEQVGIKEASRYGSGLTICHVKEIVFSNLGEPYRRFAEIRTSVGDFPIELHDAFELLEKIPNIKSDSWLLKEFEKCKGWHNK